MKDDSYGHAVADGFKSAADWLGVASEFHPYKTAEEAEAAAGLAAADPANPAIVLAAYDLDTLPVLKALKRQGARGPILGSISIAGDAYNSLFAGEPEERQTPGFFTEGVYAESPVVFDSSNAETLAFADRFRERFGRPPTLWAAQGYEAARLAVAAVRATAGRPGAADLATRRAAIRAYLVSLDSPANGVPGLNGPLWFTPERGRQQAIRMGRFQGGRFVSAPGQLVPVRSADASEIKSGAVVEIGPNRFVNSPKLFADEKDALDRYRQELESSTRFIPNWVKICVALALGLGTMIGWKRIVVTVGERIGKAHLTYGQGAVAEFVAMSTIFAADSLGLPVSTTHILSSGVAGTMAANGSGVQLATLRNIVLAWVLTLPCAIVLSASLYWLFVRAL